MDSLSDVKVAIRIFLSYAREDEVKVENLYQKLSEAGFNPWMAKKDILPGERWPSTIQKAIRSSDFFVVFLSAKSVSKRGFLQKEIADALDIWQEMLDSDIYLIPVRLEECKVPERLREFQWVNLFEKDGWARLVRGIQVGMERRAAGIKPAKEMVTPEEGRERVQGSFDPNLFVNREREIVVVTERVARLKNGEVVEDRVVVFYGPTGSGKTWLSCKLIQELRANLKVDAERFDLAELHPRESIGPSARRVLEEVFDRYVAKRPGGRDAWGAPPADNAYMRDHIVSLVQYAAHESGVAVLLLDHVNRLDRSAMDLVDEFLMLPLSQLSRVVLVLNGRQDAPTWKSSQVRFRAVEMDLRPFLEETIREQVERLERDALDYLNQIRELSGGYPLVTRLLAEAIANGATDFGDALTRCVNEILVEAPHWPPADMPDAPPLSECIKALAILSDFDEDRNKFFLAEFLHWPSLQDNKPHWHRRLNRALLDTQLVKPHRAEAGGYVIDDAVRHVVEAWLRVTQRKEWIRCHCFAMRFYERWANEYLATAVRWQARAEYHRSQLRAAGTDPDVVCS